MQLNAIIAAARALVHPTTADVPTQPPALPPVAQRRAPTQRAVRRDMVKWMGRRQYLRQFKRPAGPHDSSFAQED